MSKEKSLSILGLFSEGLGELIIIMTAIIIATMYQNNTLNLANMFAFISFIVLGIALRYKGQEYHK